MYTLPLVIPFRSQMFSLSLKTDERKLSQSIISWGRLSTVYKLEVIPLTSYSVLHFGQSTKKFCFITILPTHPSIGARVGGGGIDRVL